MNPGWDRILGLALVAGLAACQTTERHGVPASDPSPPAAAGGKVGRQPDATTPGASLASVDTVLLAHHIAPEESLAVRLVGSVGPNGSYALDAIETAQSGGHVVLRPRVRRLPGDMFVQMVVPLDATVHLHLTPGDHTIEVQGKERTLQERVRVAGDSRRAAPVVEIAASPSADAGADRIVPLQLTARVADGYVDRIEVREPGSRQAGHWRLPEFVERIPSGLRATTSIRRPPSDPERRLEARALDGQGAASEIATFVLPPR